MLRARCDAETLAAWLRKHGPHLPTRVFSAVTDVAAERGGASLRFRAASTPALQRIAGRHAACHLYGIHARPDGDHVGEPDLQALADDGPRSES